VRSWMDHDRRADRCRSRGHGADLDTAPTSRVVAAPRLGSVARGCFVLACIGYALWIAKGILGGIGPADALAVLRGERGAVGYLKGLASPVGGITTTTQLGPVVVLIHHVLRRAGRPQGRSAEITLVLLALVRVTLYAERLALIEILLPYVIIAFLVAPRRDTRPRRLLRSLAPLMAPVVLLLIFGTFEHSRSWANYYKDQYTDSTYAQFVVDRASAYYATSSNNSGLIRQGFDEDLPLPYYTVKVVWRLPLIEAFFNYKTVTGVNPAPSWSYYLQQHANPEYNNEGGLTTAAADFGLIGGGLYWLLLGTAAGYLFRGLKEGRLAALVVYVAGFIGILEVSRISYWGTGRFVPTALAAYVLVRKLRPASASLGGAVADVPATTNRLPQ
jgi:hypothetical protein